jgi:hypothetical protein
LIYINPPTLPGPKVGAFGEAAICNFGSLSPGDSLPE